MPPRIQLPSYGETVINPIALLFTIVMCITVLLVKKEYIIIPIILVACFITGMQRIVIFTVDFPMLRIIIMLGILRILIRNEASSMAFNTIDKLLICYMIIRTITYTILWKSGSAVVYMLGQSIDILGGYFFVRLAINDFKEYDTIIKTLVFMSIPIALFMLYEHHTGGRNLFSVFGGVPAWDLIREDKLRAQGAFPHPIMAGTFGSSLLPLSWGLWLRKYKLFAILGFICSFVITFASSSSGPIVTLALGIFGIFFWLFNKYTKKAKNMLFLTLICLHLVMKAPVWHLISRIDIVGGSTGYHRFLLIDAAVRNFFGWFLLGIKTTGVWGWGLDDVTNQYILEGSLGGIIPLILFILIIIKCMRTIGSARNKLGDQLVLQKYVWSLGVLLFAYIITFISVSYFGQMVFFYYLLIAMISSLNNLPSIVGDNKT